MNANYLWGILLIFLVSCLSTPDRGDNSLLYADSLIEAGCADSALNLLESMELADFSTVQLKAKYALLLTQAKDKNYITHTDDSLISIAAEFYDAFGDIGLQAKSHYYWGRVCQDRGDIEGTVREFLMAMPLVEKVGDYHLNVLLKSNLGHLFWQHGLQEAADSLYQQVIELEEAQHDSLRLAVALAKRADICLERGAEYYADADKYLKRALMLIKRSDNLYVKELVYSSYCYLLAYKGCYNYNKIFG